MRILRVACNHHWNKLCWIVAHFSDELSHAARAPADVLELLLPLRGKLGTFEVGRNNTDELLSLCRRVNFLSYALNGKVVKKLFNNVRSCCRSAESARGFNDSLELFVRNLLWGILHCGKEGGLSVSRRRSCFSGDDFCVQHRESHALLQFGKLLTFNFRVLVLLVRCWAVNLPPAVLFDNLALGIKAFWADVKSNLDLVIFARFGKNSKKTLDNKVIDVPFVKGELWKVCRLFGRNNGVVVGDLCVVDNIFCWKRLAVKRHCRFLVRSLRNRTQSFRNGCNNVVGYVPWIRSRIGENLVALIKALH